LRRKKNLSINKLVKYIKKNDVLVGFQETNENMFISPRLAFRKAKDTKKR